MQPVAYYRKIRESARSPHKVTKGSIGFDLCLNEHTTFPPFRITKVDLGIILYPPPHSYFQLVAKSGLALYQGLVVVGGVIDPDYRGEVSALIQNIGNKEQRLTKGTPIAQAISKTAIPPLMKIWPPDVPMTATERGEKGFGQCTKLYDTNFNYIGERSSPTDFTSEIKSKSIVLTPWPINPQVSSSLNRARSETPVGTVQPFAMKTPQIKLKARSEEEITTKPFHQTKGNALRNPSAEPLHPSPSVTVTLSKSPAGKPSYVRTPTLSQRSKHKNSEASLQVQYRNYELTPDGMVTKTTSPPPPTHLPLSTGYGTSRLEVSTTPTQKRMLHVSMTSIFREPGVRLDMTEKAMAQPPPLCKQWEGADHLNFSM